MTADRPSDRPAGLAEVVAHTGLALPAIGLGTYTLRGESGAAAVGRALDAGYRLLDSAFSYENEGAVGAAVRGSAVPRSRILVTSKLPGRHHEHDAAVSAIEESVYRTGLDAIDLHLIHWPNPRVDRYVQAWRAMLEARDRGLLRHLGVSNFLPEHLERLQAETGELPAVNQIELHPWFPQDEQVAWHADHGIITEAWSPLARAADLFTESVLVEAAQRHGVTVSQLVLRWHVERGVVPLPRSADPARQRENLDVAGFALTDEDRAVIASLARPDGRLKDQDPAVYEEF